MPGATPIYCACGYVMDGEGKIVKCRPPRICGLGDLVAFILGRLGITPARVSWWIGRPCGCEARKEKLNRIAPFRPREASARAR